MNNIANNQQDIKSLTPFSLKQFSLSGKSKEMEKQMLDDIFILGRLAILGQSTAFYAKPNAGKTLLTIHLIIETIKEGNINASDIFYINADDNFRGLTQKLKLAEKYGFEMLALSHNGFEARDFVPHLVQMISSKQCRSKVIILDTVKKFTDLMNKKNSSEFGEVVRQFVSHGGSVIMLAHVNKNRNEEGKVVHAGTTDLLDDADCAYTLDIIKEDKTTGINTVKFENLKSRGAVASKEVYSYDASDGSDYLTRLESVCFVGKNDQEAIERQRRLDLMLEKNAAAIDAIMKCLKNGQILKTELLKEASVNSGISKSKINKALVDHEGDNILEFQYWTVTVGEKNAHTYNLNQNKLAEMTDNRKADDETSELPF